MVDKGHSLLKTSKFHECVFFEVGPPKMISFPFGVHLKPTKKGYPQKDIALYSLH